MNEDSRNPERPIPTLSYALPDNRNGFADHKTEIKYEEALERKTPEPVLLFAQSDYSLLLFVAIEHESVVRKMPVFKQFR